MSPPLEPSLRVAAAEATPPDGDRQRGVDKEEAGYRTPKGTVAPGDARCPPAPMKRRPPPDDVVAQRRLGFYAGTDLEAFFTAHNV